MLILGYVHYKNEINEDASLREISKEVGVSFSSTRKVLKKKINLKRTRCKKCITLLTPIYHEEFDFVGGF